MTRIGHLPGVAIIVGLLCNTTLAQNITATTCASPGGFLKCMGNVDILFNTCITSTDPCDTDCKSACACGAVFGQVGCALESCWNVVYGCEYQTLAAGLVSYCFANANDIPFFPAPENAPGGCSCNLGYVSGNITKVDGAVKSCDADSIGNVARTEGCLCCLESGVLTSIYDICPQVSLSYLEARFTLGTLENVELGFGNCPSSFSQFDCVEDLGYPPIATFAYLTMIPTTSGTLVPSTTGGSITSPLSSLIVYTVGGIAQTITPITSARAAGSNPTGSNPTGSGSRVASTSGGFFNFKLLVFYTTVFCLWM